MGRQRLVSKKIFTALSQRDEEYKEETEDDIYVTDTY
jgi:hypothetical protein